MKSSLRIWALLLVALLSLASRSQAQNDRIDPEGVQALKDLVAKYQGVSSYSAKIFLQTNLKGLTPNTTRIGNEHAWVAWTREHGFRIESQREGNKPQWVARGNDRQVRVHWFRYTGTDSDAPRTNQPDFLNYNAAGLPFEIPGLNIFTGGLTVDQLDQLPINSLRLSKNVLHYESREVSRRIKIVTIDCTNEKGQKVNLTFYIGETDNVLYMFGKSVADGSDLSGILEVHSNISFGATFPDEYWKYDFPLMGEAATVTEPPPLRQSELVKQLPTITVQDINGQTFTVSADNKKAVLFYFFTPGSAQYYIDDVQQLHEEGEVRSLQVIGIAESSGPPADRTHEGLLAFMAKHHITFPVYAEESLFKSYVKEQLKNRAGGGPPLIYGKDGQLKSDATYFHTHELRAAVNSIAPIIGK